MNPGSTADSSPHSDAGDSIQANRHLRYFNIAFDVYLSFAGLFLIRFGIRNARRSENWTIGDWLINYHGGFVRRGLPGEVFLRVAEVMPVATPWLVLIVQLLCYASLLLVFRRLVLDSSKAAWIVALVLSPATISFPLFSALGGYRKEILFFASLAILIYLLIYRRTSDLWIGIYLCLVLPGLVLSHESIYFYIPYYYAALFIAMGSWRRSLELFFVPAALAYAAMLLVSAHPGNAAVAEAVCRAAGYVWQGEFIGPCGGAIYAFTHTRERTHADLVINIAARPYYWLYPLLALLAFVPVLLGALHLRRFVALRSRLILLAVTVLASGCFTLTTLYYTLDWGRFIYMHALAAALLILMIERRKQQETAENGLELKWSKAPAWALIVVYACCWDLTPTPDLGYRTPPLGVVRALHTLNKTTLTKSLLGPFARSR